MGSLVDPLRKSMPARTNWFGGSVLSSGKRKAAVDAAIPAQAEICAPITRNRDAGRHQVGAKTSQEHDDAKANSEGAATWLECSNSAAHGCKQEACMKDTPIGSATDAAAVLCFG
mmetsp:Transcript_53483/g.88795  ORF Transcript_53483/g.88795 Transcript_53483/m.88795 type:complete len:115 (-) Transcript_53483:70-414(-)